MHWPHAPVHKLNTSGTFIVTAATYNKQHFFKSSERLKALQGGLLKYAKKYEWQLEAWAVFPNHYHFIGHSPEDAQSLSKFLSHFHTASAKWINGLDDSPGRKVWFNFRETKLTNQQSYFARLNYVHQNAVGHGLVKIANEYPWCSASWFEKTATPAQVKTVYSFDTSRVQVPDDFEVE